MSTPFFVFDGGDGLGFGSLDDPLMGGIFSTLSPATDHVAIGLASLPFQFDDSTVLRELLTIYLEEVQEYEQLLYDVLAQQSLDEAVGFQLDIIGEQIGKRREGVTNDETYRRLLKVQIAINTSKGQAKTVTDVWKYLLNTSNVQLREEFPAGIRLYAEGSIPTKEILESVARTVPITVKVGFVAGVSSGQPFCFEGNTGLGFSSVESPTTGGRFVSRIDI